MCDRAIPVAKRKLGRSRQLQLASQVAAVLGSGSVLGTLATGSVIASYGGAAIALAGSFTSLFSQFLARGLTADVSVRRCRRRRDRHRDAALVGLRGIPRGGGVEQLLVILIEARPRAEQGRRYLDAWLGSAVSTGIDEVKEAINQGNCSARRSTPHRRSSEICDHNTAVPASLSATILWPANATSSALCRPPRPALRAPRPSSRQSPPRPALQSHPRGFLCYRRARAVA